MKWKTWVECFLNHESGKSYESFLGWEVDFGWVGRGLNREGAKVGN